MRYISDDGKIFDTEFECCEHESKVRREKEEELRRKEELEMERQNCLKIIKKKYEELQKLISEYENDYGVRQKPYLASIYELMNMLCG